MNTMEKCKICDKQTKYLELHHIIPKSRGGLDNSKNLIKVCIQCHGLIHNVSFNGRGGLIKESVEKIKLKEIEAQLWCDENDDLIEKKMLQLWYNNIEKLHTINYLLNNGYMTSLNIKEYIEFGKTKIRFNLE